MDRREAGIPGGNRVIRAVLAHEVRKALVGHAREVRRGVPAFAMRQSVPLQQRHTLARFLQKIRRSDACKAAADDHDIDFQIPRKRWKGFKRGSVDPERRIAHTRPSPMKGCVAVRLRDVG